MVGFWPPRPGRHGPALSGHLDWTVWVDRARAGPDNMAWDHTLALHLPPGRGVVRLYRWSRPTLSLGRNEPARGIVDPARLTASGVGLVRRPTGGRRVLHDDEITYAVIAPLKALGGARASYARINEGLAAGLASLGVPVAPAGASPALPPDAGACFREPAEGELVAGARKLVGSAQARIGPNLLQHGSILLEDDQERIQGLQVARDGGSASHDAGRGGLRGALDRPVTAEEVVEAVAGGLRSVLRTEGTGDWRLIRGGASLGEADLPADPAPELLARYRSPDWSWRR